MLFPVPVEMIYESKIRIPDDVAMSIALRLHALGAGMTIDELIDLVQFVEPLRQSENYDDVYLRKEITNAPRTVEIDPLHKRIFIHLKTHNIPMVGKGYHKYVTHSILYDPINPKLVANAVVEDSESTRSEVEVLEKFRNSDGIIKPIHVSTHKKKSGESRFEIITPLYNRGSLRTFIEKNPKSIPLRVKYKIARDILLGSSQLNAMGYVNRDNNKGNFFIHEENNIFKAVIGDVGGYTAKFEDALLRKPFGPGFRSAPPDLHKAYYENRLTEQDLLSYHVYSLGRLFYFLCFEEETPWIEDFKHAYPLIKILYKDRSNPDVLAEIETYTQKVVENTKPRIDVLAAKIAAKTIEPEERFEYIVLHMLSADPELRKTNAYWLMVFEKLCQVTEE